MSNSSGGTHRGEGVSPVVEEYGEPGDKFRLTAFARKNANLPDGGPE